MIMLWWWNGRHEDLKSPCPTGVWVQVPPGVLILGPLAQ